MGPLTSLIDWLAGTFWPARCCVCGHIGEFACRSCILRLTPIVFQKCPGCSRKSRGGIPCATCRPRVKLDSLISSTALTDTAEKILYALKYHGIQSLAHQVADRMCDLVSVMPEAVTIFAGNPLIVPVPLHPARQRQRGYNQSQLIATRIAAVTAMPLNTDTLVRVKHTGQQIKTNSRAQRLDNMRDAFSVVHGENIAGRDIVLIDDVCTTGATLEDCARALKVSGAHLVSALVFTHG